MRGMVVAPEPLAAEAGAEALARGGNAIDAAIAAGFVQGVVNPLLCGVGGSGLLFVHHAKSDRTFLIDCSCTVGSVPPPASWPAEALGRSEAYGRYILASEANQYGYRSIMVPGFVLGAWEAFQGYGSGAVTWADLLAPAERHASEGFEVYPYIAAFWTRDEERPAYPSLRRKLERAPAESAAYGVQRREGEVFTQATYGRTLRRLAASGGGDFYGGAIAEEMAADLVANGSLITPGDVSGYTAPESLPVVGSYRGVEIRAAVSGSSSSPQVLAMLQILEGFDVAAMEPNGPAYVDLLARVMRASFVDHLQLKCDPPFSVGMELLAAFTSRERAAYWQERIRHERVRGPVSATGLGSDTTHLSVTDESGNAVSWTHTLGSLAGSGVVTPGLGFLYNNFVGHFNPTPGHWDSLLPRKRGGGGSPLLLFRHGKPFMVIGAPGGSRIFTAVLQAIVNVLDHGMDMATAVAVPRFHAEEDDLVYLEPEIPGATAERLEAMGYRVVRSSYMSRVQAILVDPETGRFTAGADPRGGGGQAVIV
jgi:gamma-glutamyltranspeptidase / glutathione hydrolase